MKEYTTIYYQNKKTLKYKRVDFEKRATGGEIKLLAAAFKPKGYKLHKVVFTTITEGKEYE